VLPAAGQFTGPTGGRPANRPPNRAAGGWSAWQAPKRRPVSSNALLGRAIGWKVRKELGNVIVRDRTREGDWRNPMVI
jgi:hypothetical protein